MWRVCNFEWNDELRGHISAELLRAKLLWWTREDGILAKIFIVEDGVILTFMLFFFLYSIIFPPKNIPLPSVENKWRPKITKRFYGEFDSPYLISKKIFRSGVTFPSILFSKHLRTMLPSLLALNSVLVLNCKNFPAWDYRLYCIAQFLSSSKSRTDCTQPRYCDVTHKPLRHSNLAVKYTNNTITPDILLVRSTGKRREQLLLHWRFSLALCKWYIFLNA